MGAPPVVAPPRVGGYLVALSEHGELFVQFLVLFHAFCFRKRTHGIGYRVDLARAIYDLRVELHGSESTAHDAPVRVVEAHHRAKSVVISADLERGFLYVRA